MMKKTIDLHLISKADNPHYCIAQLKLNPFLSHISETEWLQASVLSDLTFHFHCKDEMRNNRFWVQRGTGHNVHKEWIYYCTLDLFLYSPL